MSHINALNFAMGYSLLVIVFGLLLDREMNSTVENANTITLIVIVNLTGLWLGILLQKAIP